MGGMAASGEGAGSSGRVQEAAERGREAPADEGAKFCAIDNPDCEACQ